MNILIVFGTTEGQTRKVAQFLKTEAEKHGHRADIADATDNPPPPDNYDVVLIGASLHMHKYQSSVFHYIKENAETLNKLTSGFFSVCLAALGTDDESLKELNEITAAFLKDTGWKPVDIEQVPGALRYSKYDFLKKMIMRMIAKKGGKDTDTSGDYEYTDWPKVKAFLERMIKQ